MRERRTNGAPLRQIAKDTGHAVSTVHHYCRDVRVTGDPPRRGRPQLSPGRIAAIRRACAQYPDASPAQIVAYLRIDGTRVARNSVLRYGTLQHHSTSHRPRSEDIPLPKATLVDLLRDIRLADRRERRRSQEDNETLGYHDAVAKVGRAPRD